MAEVAKKVEQLPELDLLQRKDKFKLKAALPSILFWFTSQTKEQGRL